MLPELSALIATYAAVGLKGFQHKNVIHNKYIWIVITSYCMAIFDIIVIGIVVKYGWEIALWNGTGAALGMLTAVWLHNYLVKKNKNIH